MADRHFRGRVVVVVFALTATGPVFSATEGTELVTPPATIDTTPPTVTAPVQTISKGKAGTTVPIRLKWTASDAGGIKSYELWRSTNGGAFVRHTLLAPTATSRTYLLPVDNSYRFFVLAYDNAGNASAAKYGPTFTPTVIDDRACCDYWTVAPYLPWTSELLNSAYNGTIKKLYSFRATTRGNYGYAVHYFTGRDVAYVAAVGSGWTYANVGIDGTHYASVNLNRSTAAGAQIVASKHWSTSGAHMISVGTGGSGYINVDAIVVIH
jgi:hypothetical protein